MMTTPNLQILEMIPDAELLSRLKQLAAHERIATATLVAHLAILDGRRLYVPLGYPSLFSYCTRELHFSESAAFHRIKCARAVRRFPVILDMLAQGAIHMSAVRVVSPCLTASNHMELLGRAHHKSQREVERLVAELHPLPPVPSTVRRLPRRGSLQLFSGGGVTQVERSRVSPADGATMVPVEANSGAIETSATPPGLPACIETLPEARTVPLPPPHPTPTPPRALIKPLAPDRYKVTFTVTGETRDKLQEARELLHHRIPNGDIALIFDRALTDLVLRLRRRKWGARRGDVVREGTAAYALRLRQSPNQRSRSTIGPGIHP